jgi:hypothetical protein
VLDEVPGPRAVAGGCVLVLTLGVHSVLALRRSSQEPGLGPEPEPEPKPKPDPDPEQDPELELELEPELEPDPRSDGARP